MPVITPASGKATLASSRISPTFEAPISSTAKSCPIAHFEHRQGQSDVIVEILRAAAAVKAASRGRHRSFHASSSCRRVPVTPTTSASLRWRYQWAKSFNPWIVSATTSGRKTAGNRCLRVEATQRNGPSSGRLGDKIVAIVPFASHCPEEISLVDRPRIGRDAVERDRVGLADRPSRPPVAASSSLRVTRSMMASPGRPQGQQNEENKR